ncbi:hypothetical protein ACWF9B_11665 [Streptomyces sp. NPDC055089]
MELPWGKRARPLEPARESGRLRSCFGAHDRLFGESRGSEFSVVDPVGSAQGRLKLTQFEGVAGVSPSEFLKVGGECYAQAPGELGTAEI